MVELFANGQEVGLDLVLQNREWRVSLQERLKAAFPKDIIVSVKLNIVGSIKNSPKIQQMFFSGWSVIKDGFEQQGIKKIVLAVHRPTGPEGFLVIGGPVIPVKEQMIRFENDFPLGRLFDGDVLSASLGEKQLSRQDLGWSNRQCLICQQAAKVCAKKGTHSQKLIQAATNQLYRQSFVDDFFLPLCSIEKIADTAVRACIDEVVLGPKPGLVDPLTNGAHQDMSVTTFVTSALALRPYFYQAFAIGQRQRNSDQTVLVAQLRQAGRLAENQMYQATNGVNTHKGVIFTLGLVIAAYGQATSNGSATTVNSLLEIVKEWGQSILDDDFSKEPTSSEQATAGQFQYRNYHLTGVRGEAAAGLPALVNVGLPYLRDGLGDVKIRLLDTLMALAGAITDSTLIKRGQGPAIIDQMHQWSIDFFALGGAGTPAGFAYLNQLDQTMTARNLSIGGAADYLVLTIFIGHLTGLLPD